jgi:hypothetical protein
MAAAAALWAKAELTQWPAAAYAALSEWAPDPLYDPLSGAAKGCTPCSSATLGYGACRPAAQRLPPALPPARSEHAVCLLRRAGAAVTRARTAARRGGMHGPCLLLS